MKRIDIDKEIKAKSIEKAAEKFARVLASKGYDWAADEMVESVGNDYYCYSNASRHTLIQGGRPTNPDTTDWDYYWAIENIDENIYYAWFIERIF